ncbi:hypothetical protein P43SY_000384 [Pythium insidiosum]|uniref:dihydrolipoyllysine-residue succinyltransferase n=1 Tax=Pythium insidiosum TaxID=114742 RepID=A0AAD5QD93_PYTIN|nr:hypothetical protein P43SY_000384 [Pythium insidiosum]
MPAAAQTDALLASSSPVPRYTTDSAPDVMDQPSKPSVGGMLQFFLSNALQFLGGVLVLNWAALPVALHNMVFLLLVFWLLVMMYMGPSNMTPRRKLMIATWGPPDSGIILGTLSMDMTKTLPYIQQKRKETGEHITITHVVLRAVGAALANAPSVNGHIVFGNYYTAPTVDVSCLVAIEGGRDLGVCRLPSIDKMSLRDVSQRLRGDATTLRDGKDKVQADRNKLMSLLPTYIIRPIVNLAGWLGGCLGLRIKPLGIEPYMFGGCVVTSVGMMGLELAFAPLTPFAQTPLLVTVGSIKDAAVVEDGKVVVRPMLTITTTIDHRYIDGSQGARMAKALKSFIEDPALLEPLET